MLSVIFNILYFCSRQMSRVLFSPAALSLIVLVLQNSILVVLTRYSKTNKEASGNYHTSTIVLLQESVKMGFCLILFFHENRVLGWSGCMGMFRRQVFQKDTFKLSIPAFLFNMQNGLIFFALSNLNAMDFQIWSQVKLFFAAIFSVSLLGKRLRWQQWAALLILTCGILVAQGSQSPPSAKSLSVAGPQGHHGGNAIEYGKGADKMLRDNNNNVVREGGKSKRKKSKKDKQTVVSEMPRELMNEAVVELAKMEDQAKALPPRVKTADSNTLIGITACVISGISSSYAGVYFEMVIKSTAPPLSVRNIQLSLFGIPFAALSMLVIDVIPAWRKGETFYMLQGCDKVLTWWLILIHAFGGLLVAVVVKYADNILKSFATGFAVVVSGIMSAILWGYHPTVGFVVGCILVVVASVSYHKYDTLHNLPKEKKLEVQNAPVSPTVHSGPEKFGASGHQSGKARRNPPPHAYGDNSYSGPQGHADAGMDMQPHHRLTAGGGGGSANNVYVLEGGGMHRTRSPMNSSLNGKGSPSPQSTNQARSISPPTSSFSEKMDKSATSVRTLTPSAVEGRGDGSQAVFINSSFDVSPKTLNVSTNGFPSTLGAIEGVPEETNAKYSKRSPRHSNHQHPHEGGQSTWSTFSVNSASTAEGHN